MPACPPPSRCTRKPDRTSRTRCRDEPYPTSHGRCPDEPYPTSHGRTIRWALVLIAAGLLLSAPASAQDEPDLLDAVYANQARWLGGSLGVLELPLGLRANWRSRYTWHLYPSDRLSSNFVTDVGPGLLKQRSLESRFALSRSVTDHIEVEVAWGARNRVAARAPMSFERQTIGALIRFTP